MDWNRIWYVHPNHNLANKVFCWFVHSSRQHRAMNISIFHKHRCLGLIGEGIHKSWNVEEPIFPWIHRGVWKLIAIKCMEARSYKDHGARLYKWDFCDWFVTGAWIVEARQTWSLALIEARSVCYIWYTIFNQSAQKISMRLAVYWSRSMYNY